MKMQNLIYSVDIKAPAQMVWDTMLKPKTYKMWTKAFSENSEFIGNWTQGERMKFVDQTMGGGTVALLEKIEAPRLMSAKHIATINAQGVEETTGPMSEKWVGTMEIYRLTEANNGTHLEVEIQCHPDFVKMFTDSWPKALDSLKKIAEQ